jgi:hypothetical protein
MPGIVPVKCVPNGEKFILLKIKSQLLLPAQNFRGKWRKEHAEMNHNKLGAENTKDGLENERQTATATRNEPSSIPPLRMEM